MYSVLLKVGLTLTGRLNPFQSAAGSALRVQLNIHRSLRFSKSTLPIPRILVSYCSVVVVIHSG